MQMLAGFPLKFRLAARVRTIAQKVFEHSSLLKRTARKTSVAFVSTKDTLERLQSLQVRDIRLLPQIAFDTTRVAALAKFHAPPPHDRLLLVSAGRLLYWKGFDLAIRTVAELSSRGVPVEYEILNTGPMQGFLESLARQLQVVDKVRFSGHLQQYSDVLSRIGKSHVLMHPALHEAFGNVVLEALAMGKPVVCLDIGGPAMQISTACGLSAPTTDRATAVKTMADYLEKLFYDPRGYRMASQAAVHRVQENFSLKQQMEIVGAAYDDALRRH
jgi:glycosyltransferase involved in cell wall biosynthesis